ncbi:MAG: hypothetical protein U0931_13575 [Vulcanimicrobiota bacterium]
MVEYEFSSSENETIGDLSEKMGCVGAFALFQGSLYAGAGLLAFSLLQSRMGLAALNFLLWFGLTGMALLSMGGWMRRSSLYFKTIINTQGQDVPLLMAALAELDKLYAIVAAVMTLAAGLSVLGFVLTALRG